MLSWIKAKRHDMRKLHFELMRRLNNPLLNESLTRKKRDKKTYTLEEDKQFYIKLRNKNPEAKSSSWIAGNGYTSFYNRIRKKHKLCWHDFKLSCGFDDFDSSRKRNSLEEDKEAYIKLRKKHPEAKSSEWMKKNGCCDLCQRVTKKHKLRWHDFKLSCGFDDFDRNRKYTLEEDKQFYIDLRNKHPEAKSSSWIAGNGYTSFYNRIRKKHKLCWHDFKLSCSFDDFDSAKKYTLEEDIRLYIELRKSHPEEARSSSWMQTKGDRRMYRRMITNYKLRWHEFKLSCGFNDKDVRRKYTLEEDKQSYIELRRRRPESKSSRWMHRNGFAILYKRTSKTHKLRWHNFKELCGFDD